MVGDIFDLRTILSLTIRTTLKIFIGIKVFSILENQISVTEELDSFPF